MLHHSAHTFLILPQLFAAVMGCFCLGILVRVRQAAVTKRPNNNSEDSSLILSPGGDVKPALKMEKLRFAEAADFAQVHSTTKWEEPGIGRPRSSDSNSEHLCLPSGWGGASCLGKSGG